MQLNPHTVHQDYTVSQRHVQNYIRTYYLANFF